MTNFEKFPKIPRWSRNVIVTEKIDGTNASVWIRPVAHRGQFEITYGVPLLYLHTAELGRVAIQAGSRTRFITPNINKSNTDNYGFAAWVKENAEELFKLGLGTHYGEWWGQGIQRSYEVNDKRFSLFNVSRWSDEEVRPACCHVVPTLWEGPMDMLTPAYLMHCLKNKGSHAAPGFMNPEGIVIYHTAGNLMFKKTFKNDEKGKGQ